MTLVQAAIAGNGGCVVLAADRLWTRSMGSDFTDYGFEANSPKIKSFGRYAVGFSGNAAYADAAFNLLSESLDLDSAVSLIAAFIVEERDKIVGRIIYQNTGLTPKEFFRLPGDTAIPKDRIDMVYSLMGDLDISFNGLVAGFDKRDKPRLVVIASDGEVLDATFTGNYSIGEGGDFSIIFHDQEHYDPSAISEAEAVYFAFRAKKWSEAPTSVGTKTDIIIIRRDGTHETIGEEDPLMDTLAELMFDEKKKTLRGRAERVERLRQVSNGRIQ